MHPLGDETVDGPGHGEGREASTHDVIDPFLVEDRADPNGVENQPASAFRA